MVSEPRVESGETARTGRRHVIPAAATLRPEHPLPRSLAGLAPAEPGYRVIRIAPRPLAEFDYAITWEDDLLSEGQSITINGSTLQSEESLAFNAAAAIFCHNHPSGVAEPSRADEMLTQTLKTALSLVDVRVLDHLIVAGNDVMSFAERGLL